jgi:endonuclease/exonuclease/phosphatase (EEP) superfamily protein YafD
MESLSGDGNMKDGLKSFESPWGIHTLPPMNKPSWERTRAMARDLVQNLNPAEPTVVCGDFNAAPTSAIWQDLIAGDVLRPAGRGRALLPTWGLFGLSALQLDHLFIAGPLVVTEDELGDFSGSDHKPVLSGFRLK